MAQKKSTGCVLCVRTVCVRAYCVHARAYVLTHVRIFFVTTNFKKSVAKENSTKKFKDFYDSPYQKNLPFPARTWAGESANSWARARVRS